jgi:hypothetical protein
MFWKKVKGALTKPQKLPILKEYKIVDSGLIAICIVFLQNLIAIEKPDNFQLLSLIAFSIAIPLLALHFFIVQTFTRPNFSLPTYLAKSFLYTFLIGLDCTLIGIISVLVRVSFIATFAFVASGFAGVTVYYFIRINTTKTNSIAVKEEEIPKPQ